MPFQKGARTKELRNSITLVERPLESVIMLLESTITNFELFATKVFAEIRSRGEILISE